MQWRMFGVLGFILVVAGVGAAGIWWIASGRTAESAYDSCRKTLHIDEPVSRTDGLALFDCMGIDAKTLPRVPIDVDGLPGRSLGAAITAAETVVRVRVRTARYESDAIRGTVTHLKTDVVTVYKGTAASSEQAPFLLFIPGGVERVPGDSNDSYVLGEVAPALFAGDEAILLLDSQRMPIAHSGQFIVRDGTVYASPRSTFLPHLEPMPLADFERMIHNAID